MPVLAFLSVEETCQRLSISKAFFYLLVKRGQLRTVKLGRRTLVPIEELERLSLNQASGSSCGSHGSGVATDLRQLGHAAQRGNGMENLHDR